MGENNVVSNTFVLSALLDSTGLGVVDLNERDIDFGYLKREMQDLFPRE